MSQRTEAGGFLGGWQSIAALGRTKLTRHVIANVIAKSDHDMSFSDKDLAISQASERGLDAFFDRVFEL